MTQRSAGSSSPQFVIGSLPPPRRVPFDAPWDWLAAGWRDMRTIPEISLGYGAVFAVAMATLGGGLWEADALALLPALAGSVLLVGPIVASGLYEASRRLSEREKPSLSAVLQASLGARGQLAFFGSVLLFIFMIWLQLAFLMLMLFLGTSEVPPGGDFLRTLLLTPRGLSLLVAGSLVGGLIAALVFAIAAVGVPLLMSEQIDCATAARASIAAVARNPKPMALWAILIVAIMGAGFAMLLVGLVIAFPLIGHATWHACADIYGDRRSPAVE